MNIFSLEDVPNTPPSELQPITNISNDITKNVTDDRGEKILYFLNIKNEYIERDIKDEIKNPRILFSTK